VDATVKAGLLELIDHAVDRGWTRRRAAVLLGVDQDRVRRWTERRTKNRLDDSRPGGMVLHALLPAERAAIVQLFETWGGVDRSHRKLAHRGSRLDLVHVAESTVLRVLKYEGLVLPGKPAREPAVRPPWPEWVTWKPNVIWCYDFTHFTRARRVAVAVIDVVSRKWLATLVSAEQTSTQVEACFLATLTETGLDELLDARLLENLRTGTAEVDDLDDEQVPVLLAMSDNGPQMRSHSTREFMVA
jgi:putative transposase